MAIYLLHKANTHSLFHEISAIYDVVAVGRMSFSMPSSKLILNSNYSRGPC